jgi:hypothetical protein
MKNTVLGLVTPSASVGSFTGLEFDLKMEATNAYETSKFLQTKLAD